MELTEKKLADIDYLITKLKINFPMISTPNPNVADETEKLKKIEWVNQLKDLPIEITIQAINNLIKSPIQEEIDLLIKQPLVELRELTKIQYQENKRNETLKLERREITEEDKQKGLKILAEARKELGV